MLSRSTVMEPEPEPEPEAVADDDEEFDDGVYEDGGSEDGEGDEDSEDGCSDEDEVVQEEFVVNGTPMTKQQQLALRAKSGFVPASEGLDPSKWKSPHMRLSKFAGRPPTCVFGLGCAPACRVSPACFAALVLLGTALTEPDSAWRDDLAQHRRSAASGRQTMPAGVGTCNI